MRIASRSEGLLDSIFNWMNEHPRRPVLGTCAGAWRIWSEGYATYTLTVGGLERIKSEGVKLTDTAENYIDFIGTSGVTNTPEPLGIAFIIFIAIMYLALIWAPKQS